MTSGLGCSKGFLARTAAAAAVLLAAVVTAAGGATLGETVLVGRADGPAGAAADAGSAFPSISSNGRTVAFRSDADNLSSEDDDSVSNVYVRDLRRDTTTLVSRADGLSGAAANGNSFSAAIAGNGRKVAFLSEADNLSGEDNDAVFNVYLRDVRRGTTELVSRATGEAGAGSDDNSHEPSISQSGKVVAFSSHADNLSGDDDKSNPDVFVRDVRKGTTTLASRVDGEGGAGALGFSAIPSLSANGKLVAFQSDANNLSGEDNDSVINVYMRDLRKHTTTFVSRADGPAGVGGDGDSAAPSIARSRYVAFESDADNLSGEDNNTVANIFVRDLKRGRTILVSRASGLAGAAADGDSRVSSISSNRRFVAFHSLADNLSTEDDDSVTNVFLRDLRQDTTTLVSRADGLAGAGGDDGSSDASVARNGIVVFTSAADNLSTEDNDAFLNVFVRR